MLQGNLLKEPAVCCASTCVPEWVLGAGVVTAVLGLLLAVFGVCALRYHGALRFWALPLLMGSAVLAILIAWGLRVYVFPEYRVYGLGLGVLLVAAGGVIGVVASWRLRRLAASGPSVPPI